MPKSFLVSTCIAQESIFVFEDSQEECDQTDLNNENVYLQFGHYFQNFTVIANPDTFNISKYEENIFEVSYW